MRICCLAIVAVVLSSCGLVEIGGNGGKNMKCGQGLDKGLEAREEAAARKSQCAISQVLITLTAMTGRLILSPEV